MKFLKNATLKYIFASLTILAVQSSALACVDIEELKRLEIISKLCNDSQKVNVVITSEIRYRHITNCTNEMLGNLEKTKNFASALMAGCQQLSDGYVYECIQNGTDKIKTLNSNQTSEGNE